MLRFIKCICVRALVVGLTFLPQKVALATGDFTLTCRNITINGASLEAFCKTINGQEVQTGINLNNYIVNINGQLGWARQGNFIASSRDCVIRGNERVSILDCKTVTINGFETNSSLNLDERIVNINGSLIYSDPN
jgi:hypothetical protein